MLAKIDSKIHSWKIVASDTGKVYEANKKNAKANTREAVSVDKLACQDKPGRPVFFGTLLNEEQTLFMGSQQAVFNLDIVISVAKALLLKNN